MAGRSPDTVDPGDTWAVVTGMTVVSGRCEMDNADDSARVDVGTDTVKVEATWNDAGQDNRDIMFGRHNDTGHDDGGSFSYYCTFRQVPDDFSLSRRDNTGTHGGNATLQTDATLGASAGTDYLITLEISDGAQSADFGVLASLSDTDTFLNGLGANYVGFGAFLRTTTDPYFTFITADDLAVATYVGNSLIRGMLLSPRAGPVIA